MEDQGSNTSQPNNSETPTRKFVKDRGHDSESHRKNREDKAIQLRKEKRADRTNIERRKFKIDSKETESTISTHQLRRLDILPKKAALLYDPDPKMQFESAVYFRRVLAADKNPPLDMILQIGTVIPALTSFLTRFENPKLQLEAAWSLTNIACGEPRHIQALLSCNVIQLFANLVSQTSYSNIKEQSLWALSNISSEEIACSLLCQEPDLLKLILLQIGVNTVSPDPTNQPDLFKPQHLSENDNPSLSIMRHITFICGNVLKQKPQINGCFYHCILFAFGDLLQSPDEEIKLDICQTIATAVSQQPEIIALIAEQGMISRLKELALETSSVSTTKELAMVAICTIFKLASPLLRRAMILNFQLSNTPLLSLVTTLLCSTSNNASRRDAIQALIAWSDLGTSYKAAIVNLQLWTAIKELSLQGHYDVKTDIVMLVCRQFPEGLPYFTAEVTQLMLEICRELISYTDGEALFRILQSISFLLKLSASNCFSVRHLPSIHEKIEYLSMHQVPAIAEEAVQVERLIQSFLRKGEGGMFDEYEI